MLKTIAARASTGSRDLTASLAGSAALATLGFALGGGMAWLGGAARSEATPALGRLPAIAREQAAESLQLAGALVRLELKLPTMMPSAALDLGPFGVAHGFIGGFANVGKSSDLTKDAAFAAPPDVRSVDAMMERFGAYAFDLADVRKGAGEVPRLYLAALPLDMHKVAEPDRRKEAFLTAMLPLVLKANEAIAQDRAALQGVAERVRFGVPLAAGEESWLAALAERHGAEPDDLAELKLRVDIVPPSLALAQAAEESGWGTSRPARKANALFGQMSFDEGAGAKPRRGELRAFDDLHGSVAAYMHNLNTHAAYKEFRRQRAALRARGLQPDGERLAGALKRYSERGEDYIETLRLIIRGNGLDEFDRARLSRASMPPPRRPSPRVPL
jgi:Bax protein